MQQYKNVVRLLPEIYYFVLLLNYSFEVLVIVLANSVLVLYCQCISTELDLGIT